MSTLRKSALWGGLLLLVLGLALRGPACLGQLWANAGWVALGQALAEPPTTGRTPQLLRSETFFQRATSWAPQNRSAWRGLGYVLAQLGREEAALAAWQHVEGIAGELIRWGEQARRGGDDAEALTWYRRAAEAQPGQGTPWYYAGLAHEGLEQWEEALESYHTALSLPLEAGIGRSDLLYRMGWLQARRIEPADLTEALESFETAIAAGEFSNESRETQAHFQRAEALYQLGYAEEALDEYEWVIARQPDPYWTYTRLGTLYWEVEGDAEQAEASLRAAIALRPDFKWAYRELARLYEETGRTNEAIELYEQVLSLDAQDRLARERLDELLPPGEP